MTAAVETVLSRFTQRARERADELLYTFVDQDGRDQASLTVGQLFEAASEVAGFLRTDAGLAAGDRALLVYTPSLDFARAFIGCLLARVVPVPVTPPNPYNLERDLPALGAIARSARARAVLTDSDFAGLKMFVDGRPDLEFPPLPWHTTSGLRHAPITSIDLPAPSDVAFVQYTSGSTSTPRGVLITHGNVTHQLELNAKELGMGNGTPAVMWVPHYHDFGLISGLLSALSGNVTLWWMSPLTFVQRPHLWFDVMSRVKATHTAAPNFAYELAARKTTEEQRKSWDLSSVRVIMSAAEPIRLGTVRAFLAAFEASRLDPRAFCPAYGLAEHSVGVSVFGRTIARLDREALERDGEVRVASAFGPGVEYVGCGSPSVGVDVRIVDPETCVERGKGRVGEIWVDSPSKAAGYDGLEEETRAMFQARLANDESGAGYLRTGDLGFVHDGEIFVCGRIKDTLIVRGRNIHPQDVEESVREAHSAIRLGGIAAFAVAGDAEVGDRIALLVELKERSVEPALAEAVAAAVRERVLADHAQRCELVILAKPGTVLKTSSGKLRRRACRLAYEKGELAKSVLFVSRASDVAAETARAAEPRRIVARTADDLAAWLVAAVRARAPGVKADLEAPVQSFGLDSLAITALATQLSDHVGFAVAPSVVYANGTLARIAKELAEETAKRAAGGASAATTSSVATGTTGPVIATSGPRFLVGASARFARYERFGGTFDRNQVREFWRKTLGVSRPWPFEDAMYGAASAFVGKITLEDPAAFQSVAHRGCLYLVNHQVTIESAILSTLVSGVTGRPMVGLAKIEGRASELGWFMEHMFSYPGSIHPGLFAYLDRSKPDELMEHIGRLAEQLKKNERHVLVHVQGTRATSAREEVALLNPMFVEMALGTGAPIVPVRLTGGLPVEPLKEKLEAPYRFGAQDYWFGRPILPEDLAPLGFVERSEKVLAAINGLGPSAKVEEPNPPNAEITEAVRAWSERTGVSEFIATVWAVLARAPEPAPEVARLVEGARTGRLVVSGTAEDRWLAELARGLYGKRGPEIVTG